VGAAGSNSAPRTIFVFRFRFRALTCPEASSHDKKTLPMGGNWQAPLRALP
jgi:hypothetical protein